MADWIWLPVFKEVAQAVREAVMPLVGTELAGELVKIKPEGDVTTKVDAAAEEAATKVLEESGMSFTLISEESGRKEFGKEKGGTIVLDPLDGSANAIRGIPAFSVSIAFSKGNRLSEVCEALVVDLVNGVLFESELHKGAKRNGSPISSSKVIRKLSESMIGVDLNLVDLRIYSKKIMGILNIARRKRYLGSNALEVCLVACGKYDAFIDLRGMSRVTDTAAACLILKEAGGVMVNERGVEVDVELLPTSRLSFVAVANGQLCKNILANLQRG
nr:inositol monophosphatase family protein [Candidatus Njordarchaeota archaeon]